MPEILRERQGHVLVATLNRPDIHNAMSHTEMIDAMVSLCEEANADKDVRAMVLTGAGKSFCAGGNIKDMLNQADMFGGKPETIAEGYRQGIQRIPLALWNVEVPVIAAVNGAAVGAGCDMAMMCDVRIASEKARFAESFVKLGIIPGDGGAWFLPRVIGPARAAQMSLTGDMISASQALEWGMVSEVVAPETLLERSIELAQSIASNPPQAVRKTKHLLRQSATLSLPDMLDQSAEIQSHLHHTEDHREALKAFMEKRKGDYSGR